MNGVAPGVPSAPTAATRVLTVLWPAFMAAGVLEMLVFALIDPQQLHGFGFDASGWPRGAVYTVAFLVFWLVVAVASAVSVWLVVPEAQARD